MSNIDDIETSTRRERDEPSACVMILGRLMQTTPVLVTTSVFFGAGTLVSLLTLLSIYDNTDVIGVLGLGTGLIGGLLSILVYKAPFNLVKILNGTIDGLVTNNEQLALTASNLNLSIERHQQLNIQQGVQIETLKNTNASLKRQVESLTRVEKGLKTTSENLLRLLTETIGNNKEASKINAALSAVADDIANAVGDQDEHMSQFMAQLLSMETLEQRLTDTTVDNELLSHRFEAVLNNLEKITESQEKLMFDDQMSDLARWIDDRADGDHGIRQALETDTLTKKQLDDLQEFLVKLDQVIQLHDQTLQISKTVVDSLALDSAL